MSAYDDLIIANAKCVSYWPLDDVTGSARDAKGSNPATTVGSGITRQQPGPVVQSLAYKGNDTVNARVSVPHAAALNGPGTTFELEFWVQFNGDQQRFFVKAGTHQYQVVVFANGAVWGVVGTTSSTYTALAAAGTLRSGEWALVSVAWGGNLLTILVNGVVVAFVVTAGTITTNTAALELFSQTAAYYVNDSATRFAFYNAVLTTDERNAHYKSGLFEQVVYAAGRPARKLSFALCDSSGAVISDLPVRSEGAVEVTLNGQRTATVTASLEEDVAYKVRPYATWLKVWLSGAIIFAGQVNLPRWLGGQRRVELNAVDVTDRIANGYTKAFAKATSVDQSEIMWDLLDHLDARSTAHTGPGLGIDRGSTPNSYLRTRYYADGQSVWDAIIAMSQVTNGPDFEFEPIDQTNGVMARFNTFFPYQGNDRTDTCVFTFNTMESNTVDFTSEPGGGEIINYATFGGQAIEGEPAPAWIAYNDASIDKYGLFEHMESLPDVKYTATLQEYAEQLVQIRSEPIEFFDLVPASEAGSGAQGFYRDANGLWKPQSGGSYGTPPAFGPLSSGGDYWIGDEIRAIGRDHGMDKDVSGRVISARISEVGEHGDQVAVELTCAPTINASGVSGVASSVSTEDFG